MVPMPFGAIAAATSIVNQSEMKERMKKEKVGRFRVVAAEDTIHISYTVPENFDWAAAAYAMLNICHSKGQGEKLIEMMENTDPVVRDIEVGGDYSE